ncbi:MAG: CC_3452 family protein [Sphingomonas sp.]
MIRSLTLLLGLAVASAPVGAANYSAKLAAPASGRFIARDITWNCGTAACQGATEESRPVVLCQSLAKKAGRVETFLVDGRAFTSAELERCNASAKAAAAKSLAEQ